jgi:hypothetical protein
MSEKESVWSALSKSVNEAFESRTNPYAGDLEDFMDSEPGKCLDAFSAKRWQDIPPGVLVDHMPCFWSEALSTPMLAFVLPAYLNYLLHFLDNGGRIGENDPIYKLLDELIRTRLDHQIWDFAIEFRRAERHVVHQILEELDRHGFIDHGIYEQRINNWWLSL